MKQIFLLLLIFANIINIFAQDTIFWETPLKYTSEDKEYKGYASSLEIIKFSDDFYKLEECYYFENKRIVYEYYTEIYKFKDDSVLFITKFKKEPTKWIYNKKDDTIFSVSLMREGRVVVAGEVSN